MLETKQFPNNPWILLHGMAAMHILGNVIPKLIPTVAADDSSPSLQICSHEFNNGSKAVEKTQFPMGPLQCISDLHDIHAETLVAAQPYRAFL